MKDYIPLPVDTGDVELGQELEALVEAPMRDYLSSFICE